MDTMALVALNTVLGESVASCDFRYVLLCLDSFVRRYVAVTHISVFIFSDHVYSYDDMAGDFSIKLYCEY